MNRIGEIGSSIESTSFMKENEGHFAAFMICQHSNVIRSQIQHGPPDPLKKNEVRDMNFFGQKERMFHVGTEFLIINHQKCPTLTDIDMIADITFAVQVAN